MQTPVENHLIEEALENIKNNKLFKRSSLQERVLRFLIDQAIDGSDVNEHSIGIALYKGKYTADQNDSKIRVYVYYLRKKLDEYYRGIGKNESIKFHIEKGQYNLTFKENVPEEKTTNRHHNRYIQLRINKYWFGASLLLIAVFIWTPIIYKKNQNKYCWDGYFKNDSQNLCVVADHYAIADITDPKLVASCIYNGVNNDRDLFQLQKSNPKKELRSGDFSLFSKMAPFGVKYLDSWFAKYGYEFKIQLESETQFADYSTFNVIYIGQSKTMQNSKSIFLENSKVFSVIKDGFVYNTATENIKYVAHNTKIAHDEYAMVSYQKFDNGKHALFFVSNHDIGVLGTLKKFISTEGLREFYKKLPNNKCEFNALFNVAGLRRTDMSCDLVQLEIIEGDKD